MKINAIAAIVAPVLALGVPLVWTKVAHVRASLLDTRPAGEIAAAASATAAVAVQPKPAAPAPAPAIIEKAVPEVAELHAAIEQGIVRADLRGNGRDWIRARLENPGKTAITVTAEVGQMFESGLNAVILVRPASAEIAPGRTAEIVLQTASTRSANRTTEQAYRLTYGKMPKLDRFLGSVQQHPQLTTAAVQTAVLALAENLPLSAVSKFPSVAGEIKSRFNTDAFRVETTDLIAALAALREAGVPDTSVVMTVDRQLKIEAMIEPLCRAAAMSYYGLTAETEWNFWRHELLEGEPTTRHYALYGIARFYPDTALEMLPKWAREARTTPVFRLAAVQALAETQRPEALPILRRLADELGLGSELGRAAAGAAQHLETRLGESATRQPAIAFRASVGL